MIKFEWDLTDLFNNDEEVQQSMSDIKKKLVELDKYRSQELTSELLLKLLDKLTLIKELSNNVLVYSSLKYYKDVKNKECEGLKSEVEKFNNEVSTALKFIDLKILELGKDKVQKYIKENSKLNKYELYLDNIFRLNRNVSEDVILKVKENNNKINEELMTYNNLLSKIKYGSIKIDEEEKEITGLNLGKYLCSDDRSVRKQVFHLLNSAYKEQEDSFGTVLNNLYGLRITNARLEGYSSVLEQSLFQENIDSNIVDALIDVVNSNLPVIQEYLKIKTNVSGIEDAHLYDFNNSIVKDVNTTYTLEEAVDIIKAALKPLGSKYLEVVEKLLNAHIDAIPNENRHQTITFSWHTYSFLNFKGGYVDLKNLIHELGHIVNYYLSKEEQIYLYEDSSVFVGEIASLVNEILLNRYLYENATTTMEKMFYLSKNIENFFTTVYKQTMYTEFQKELFDIRENMELTTGEIGNKYKEIISKYYGENVIIDDEIDIEWARLGHIFRWSFYNYKYATGLLMASATASALLDEKTLSTSDYMKFLSSGSSQYSLDLIKILNIDLTNKDIIDNGFRILEKDVALLNKVL